MESEFIKESESYLSNILEFKYPEDSLPAVQKRIEKDDLETAAAESYARQRVLDSPIKIAAEPEHRLFS